jgi:hypothetical protein
VHNTLYVASTSGRMTAISTKVRQISISLVQENRVFIFQEDAVQNGDSICGFCLQLLCLKWSPLCGFRFFPCILK